ncbi:iron-containing redox enzyme family protein [Labedaea rhizosphaerae]|uniref:Heme oxygenase-like protein n=1 Tax=Labedaea rhizosphaerae TaxID=598644 RepID=A0A4R6S055_LABRH|nr:iron-containing redox enzyme family protein [Labedaea rhizosphaerae]TDP92862.1 heme oxygenase-like protein [Labedaea rhizosphaerae]
MTALGLNHDESVSQQITSYADNDVYRPQPAPYVVDNPYRRPLDRARLAGIDWQRPLTEDRFTSDDSLLANRLLMNIYESDSMFLPIDGLRGKERDFAAFYDPGSRVLADRIRPTAERFALGFLEESVQVNGHWDEAGTLSHLEATIHEATTADFPVQTAIEQAADPRRAAEMLMVQMALDGLTEATAMSQNLGGAFGPEQSELFKIFIDEFGYGVFDAKHSSLFTDLCRSVGMRTTPHHYWFFYLPSSIAVNNYFYRVTHDRTGFFRYIGAMALLEATFAPWFARLTTALRGVFGDAVDTRYCDEHAHIDQHHGRMAVHELLMPLARKHGPVATRGLIRGVEEIRLLSSLADADLLAQLAWTPTTRPARSAADLEQAPGAPEIRDLGPATAFETRVADADTSVDVSSGSVQLHFSGTGDPLTVAAGSGVTVPKGRLYGLAADADAVVVVSTR